MIDTTTVGMTPEDHTGPSLLVRAAWFLLVGWWAGAAWTAAAYAVTLTVVGLPLAVWMYGQLPFVVSLYRY